MAHLIEEGHADGMDEEELEQMQAALIASMADQEDIVINDDDDDEQDAQAMSNQGLLNQMFGYFGMGGNQGSNEEEKKD